MAASQISAIFKQAMLTFTCKKEFFYQNLEILRAILDKTTSDDVDLHPQFMRDSLWDRPNKAPVTYIDIFEDKNISMGIFILKPGMHLPLHDHPHMYGLIKVISGTVKITSFSHHKDYAQEEISHSINAPKQITVERNVDLIVDTSTEPCLLEPFKGNLHEIESVNGPAAFLDVLAPPYETEIVGNGPRKCTYYRILKELAPRIFRLEEIDAPSWFWNDTYPYTGPQILS